MQDREGMVTWRGIAVGAVLAAGVGALGSYCDTCQQGTRMTDDYSAPAALFVVFLVAAPLNTGLRALRKSWALTPAELCTVFAMAMVAAAIPTRGFVGFLTPTITGAHYYASPQNQWDDFVLPYLPQWMVLTDLEAIRWYYEGLPAGIAWPWSAWAGPLFFWLLFFVAMGLVMIAVPVILRRQWMDFEKLTYPMSQAPLALVDSAKEGAGPSIFRSRLFWAGFGVSALIITLNGLSYYVPTVSAPRMEAVVRGTVFTGSLRFRISPIVLGFSYFMHQS
ncbi:MAG: hypothetical protein FJ279_06030, partial [Planctomycetes bacterium]|nr:hypothetical protein [Planctomycetota bacterium]